MVERKTDMSVFRECESVQKRVNSRLEMSILRKACSQCWLLAGVWELGIWEGSQYSQN